MFKPSNPKHQGWHFYFEKSTKHIWSFLWTKIPTHIFFSLIVGISTSCHVIFPSNIYLCIFCHISIYYIEYTVFPFQTDLFSFIWLMLKCHICHGYHIFIFIGGGGQYLAPAERRFRTPPLDVYNSFPIGKDFCKTILTISVKKGHWNAYSIFYTGQNIQSNEII